MENKSNKKNVPMLVGCIVMFVIMCVLQKTIGKAQINGIIAQFHVMISIVLVLTNRKTGFIMGTMLNILNLLMVMFGSIIMGHDMTALPSLAISVCTIIIIAIIYNYTNKNDSMHNELMEKYEQEIESKRILQEKDEVLSYLAYYDRLTQMPNRHLFMENLEDNIINKKQCVVICINLDDFRRINDDFGMSAGDELIRTYAGRIEKIAGDNNFAARISGDEFAIILGPENNNQDIINFAGQIQNIFFEPVNVEGKAVGVSSSIGIAMFPRDADGAEDILRCAEKAMFMSKNNGKNKICFFSPVV